MMKAKDSLYPLLSIPYNNKLVVVATDSSSPLKITPMTFLQSLIPEFVEEHKKASTLRIITYGDRLSLVSPEPAVYSKDAMNCNFVYLYFWGKFTKANIT